MKHSIFGSTLAALVLSVMASPIVASADTKTYQVTGPVLEASDSVIVVQKGKDKWEIARTPETKVEGDLKPGSKVTIQYAMTAKSVEAKAAPGERREEGEIRFPIEKYEMLPSTFREGASRKLPRSHGVPRPELFGSMRRALAEPPPEHRPFPLDCYPQRDSPLRAHPLTHIRPWAMSERTARPRRHARKDGRPRFVEMILQGPLFRR